MDALDAARELRSLPGIRTALNRVGDQLEAQNAILAELVDAVRGTREVPEDDERVPRGDV